MLQNSTKTNAAFLALLVAGSKKAATIWREHGALEYRESARLMSNAATKWPGLRDEVAQLHA
jgi:hypothetical protein